MPQGLAALFQRMCAAGGGPVSRPDDALRLWLAGLAGLAGEAAVPGGKLADPQLGPEQADGAALRQLIYAHRAQREQGAQTPSATSEATHWQRLCLGLGLGLQPLAAAPFEAVPPTAKASRLPRWRRLAANQPVWAWVAGIAALAVLLPWPFQPSPGTNDAGLGDADTGVVMRGGAAVQVLLAPNAQAVRAHADQLGLLLARYQVPCRRVDLADGSIQFQARVAVGSPLARDLQAMGVTVPVHGRLNLLIRELMVRP